MTEGAPEIQPQQDANPSGGINPAWNDALNDIPREYHEKVIPHFKNWDTGFNTQLQKVHSQYEAYKPYEPFVQNQVPFEEVQQGYGLLRAIYENPQGVIGAIQQAFNLGEPVDDQGVAEEIPDETAYAQLPPNVVAQLQRQDQMLNTMAQIMAKEREQQLAYNEGIKLDKYLASLHEQHGDFDEGIVLQLAAQMDGNIDSAFQAYQNAIQQEVSRRNSPVAPRLISPGGSAPSNAIDPRKLNSRQTKDLIVDMLKAAQSAKG